MSVGKSVVSVIFIPSSTEFGARKTTISSAKGPGHSEVPDARYQPQRLLIGPNAQVADASGGLIWLRVPLQER